MAYSNRIKKAILTTILAASALTAGSACGVFRAENGTANANSAVANTTSNTAAAPAMEPAEPLELGNPSNATADPENRDNYLLVRSTAAMSYNNSRGTANWVAWKTTKSLLGRSIPRPDFEPDPQLPKGFTRITTRDYTGSGFQRGHMVPSADRFGDRSANAETFLMTNIVPQLGGLNEFPWENLESYVRSRVRRRRNAVDAFQLAGCYGEKDRLKNRVTAPTNCWKVVVFVPEGEGISAIGKETEVIAVDMPNENGLPDDWRRFRVTVREIETRTGLDLLSRLPKEIQDELETRR